MKAWIARHYGGPEVLRLEEVPTPSPKQGEVLIRVHATTVNSGDVRVRGLDMPPGMTLMGRLALGWNGPRQPVLGTELAGVVEAVGQDVTRYRSGDCVIAFFGGAMGAHAEYATIPEIGRIALMPGRLDFTSAAGLCFGGTTALHYLRQAGLQPGQSILVLGGSGAVGLSLVQLARHQGADVTATTSAPNRDLLTRFGSHQVIDYTATNPLAGPARYDIVADCVAATDFARAQKALKPGGRYLAIAGGIREMLGSLRKGADGTRMIAGPAAERAEDIVELARLAEAGTYVSHVDRVFSFSDLPAAHAYVDTGRKRGSVVVTVAD
ncbi:MAG: NAD(P)-dependent alcohol dehydrogenase [Devosia sp.]|uniref:NAD(P)-dependent alcohol dehydrogenase n=1 Tax=Devosia sp. TaxID=1871048 RepID=UPI0024C794C2|nr:NAD(P)-dependent alcohol dehydrogenase [Devosia sp.]UYN99517.1 MAG: NAD(P)-dependent alcohol dehydrogenase [Devosia sp.]